MMMDDLATPGHVTPVVDHVTLQAGHVAAPLADNEDDTISTVSQENTTTIKEPLSDNGDSETLSVADLFIMQASSDSFKSYRYDDTGSPFIRALVTTFYRHAHDHHIEALAEIVRNAVNSYSVEITELLKRTYPNSEIAHIGQMPKATCNFTKLRKLYLKPGVNMRTSDHPYDITDAVYPTGATQTRITWLTEETLDNITKTYSTKRWKLEIVGQPAAQPSTSTTLQSVQTSTTTGVMDQPSLSAKSKIAETSQNNVTENLVQAAVMAFMASPKIPGVCYASSLIAMGEFDHRGGELKLDQCDEVKMIIPPNSLGEMQLVYFALELDHHGDLTTTMSPIFLCGPPGLNFKERHPVLLTFPHAAVDVDVCALSKSESAPQWDGDGASVQTITRDVVTLEIRHFTRDKLSVHDGRIPSVKPSRIPVRNGEGRNRCLPGKRLSVAAFSSSSSVSLHIVLSTLPSKIFETAVDHEMIGVRRFVKIEEWKQVTFRSQRGGLQVEAKLNNKDYEIRVLSEDRVMQRQKERIDYDELPPKACLALHVHQREPNKDCDLHLLADIHSKTLEEIPQNTEDTFNFTNLQPQNGNSDISCYSLGAGTLGAGTLGAGTLGAGTLDTEATTYGVQESGLCDHYGGNHLPTCPLVGQPLDSIDIPSTDSSMDISRLLRQDLHSEDSSLHSEDSVHPFSLGERTNVQTIPPLVGPS